MRFYLLTTSRVLVQLLDLLGVAAVGALGLVASALITETNTLEFDHLALVLPTQDTFYLLVFLAPILFVGKSILSAALLRKTSLFLANVEAKMSEEVAAFIFLDDLSRLKAFPRALAHFTSIRSTNAAISGLLQPFSQLLSESALFFGMAITFILVDTYAAFALIGYLTVVLLVFQWIINPRLSGIASRLKSSSIQAGQALLEINDVFRELFVSRSRDFYIELFGKARRNYSRGNAEQQFLIQLPRFFVESSLILGLVSMIFYQQATGGLQANLGNLAVFLAGGARMVGGLLPLQNAVATIRSNVELAAAAQGVVNGNKPEIVQKRASWHPALKVVGEPLESAPSLRADSLNFGYPDSDSKVIRDATFEIPPGKLVAFVGPSGAGKTTLIDLLLGLLQPSSGAVTINGRHPRNLLLEHPGAVGYVPQRPALVSGSIRQNVALGIPPNDIDDDRVRRALLTAQLHSFLTGVDGNLEANIGDAYASMSGGEVQRMGIARALYSNPKLLVLDEATSSLDSESEYSISKTLENLVPETTVIVIAHRLTTIKNANIIFVIEDGQVTSSGTFRELCSSSQFVEDYVRRARF